MDPQDFKTSTMGKCIKTPEGYYAYVPNPLPLKLSYDHKLISLLSEADRLLGELSGTGRVLANPYLLISSYTRREAVHSSRIEGTQASLNDLFFFEATETEKPQKPDVKEVGNYVRAMDHGIMKLKDIPISLRLIKEIHKVLMEGVRGKHAAPGVFRQSQNWIGPPGCSLDEATFIPPPVSVLKSTLNDWEKYLHSNSTEPPLIQCALMHYQFEAIHPFLDGNGRIGRLLITFFLCEKKYLSQPLLYLSAFFDKYRDEYYSRLLSVSQKGDWKNWLEFFLRGIAVQSNQALADAKKLLGLHDKYKKIIESSKKVPALSNRIADVIFENPIISINLLAKRWNVPYNSVSRSITKLMKLGILKVIPGRQRNRIFYAPELLDILISKENS